MAVFKIEKDKPVQLLEDEKFANERSMEDFFFHNAKELLGVRHLERQREIRGGRERIDILGIDNTNSPVIIELKLDKGGDDVLTQAQSYYSWLLDNGPSYEDLVERELGKGIIVNWELPKIVLVAKRFSERVERAVEHIDYVELVKYSFYKPDIFKLEGEELSTRLLYDIKNIGETQKNNTDANIDFGIHLGIVTSDETKQKISFLRDKILQLPSVKEVALQTGVAYKKGRGKFVRFEFRPTWIQVLLKYPSFKKDTKKIVRDITSFKWGYNGKIRFDSDSNVDYIFEITKEAYEQTS